MSRNSRTGPVIAVVAVFLVSAFAILGQHGPDAGAQDRASIADRVSALEAWVSSLDARVELLVSEVEWMRANWPGDEVPPEFDPVGATQSLLGVLSQALTAYEAAEGCYPGAKVYAVATDDPQLLFDALYYGPDRYKPETSKSKGIGCAQGPILPLESAWLRLAGQLDSPVPEDAVAQPLSAIVVVDSWGNPVHYIEYASKEPNQKAPVRIGEYAHSPRNRESYDLFSAGPDGTLGTADDIGNW